MTNRKIMGTYLIGLFFGILIGLYISKSIPSNEIKPIIKKNKTMAQIISDKAFKYKVSPYLIRAVISVESGGNPNIINSVGASGLMQIKADVHRALIGKRNILEPEVNIEVGTRLLSGYIKKHGLKEGLARYNGQSKNRSDTYYNKVLMACEHFKREGIK